MLAVLALLVVGATAAPQIPLYNYNYPVYSPAYQYQYYMPQTQFRYVPAYNYYPKQVADAKLDTEVKASTRLINLPGFNMKTVGFDATLGQKMFGSAEFRQNIFTGSDSEYTIWMRDSTDGTLKLAGNTYQATISATCATGGTKLTDITAPPFLINGFYLKGRTDAFNLDGANGKTSLTGMRVVILNTAGTTIVGCTDMFS